VGAQNLLLMVRNDRAPCRAEFDQNVSIPRHLRRDADQARRRSLSAPIEIVTLRSSG